LCHCRALRRGGKAIDGLDVVLRHDAHIPYSLPVCQEAVTLVKRLMVWRPENHMLYSDEIQQRVAKCLLVLEANNEEHPELGLPLEVMLIILSKIIAS
jgi:hypothetical protein